VEHLLYWTGRSVPDYLALVVLYTTERAIIGGNCLRTPLYIQCRALKWLVELFLFEASA